MGNGNSSCRWTGKVVDAGQSLLDKGEPQKAIPYLRAAAREYPQHPAPKLVWADALFMLGKYSDAEQLATSAMSDPNARHDEASAGFGYFVLGKVALAQGQHARASEAFEKALAIKPESESVRHGLRAANEGRARALEAESRSPNASVHRVYVIRGTADYHVRSSCPRLQQHALRGTLAERVTLDSLPTPCAWGVSRVPSAATSDEIMGMTRSTTYVSSK